MIVRKLNSADLPEILRVYDSQDNILKIKKTVHIDLHYTRAFKLFVNDDPSMIAYGIFDRDTLIAFTTGNMWTTLPYWTNGLFYIDSAYINSIHSIDIVARLKSAIIEYAESKKIYSGFSISTINALEVRMWQEAIVKGGDLVTALWDGDTIRYAATIEEIIPPYSQSKHRMFSQMLGITECRNSVPLVVAKWSMLNTFRNHHMSERHTQRLNKLSNA